jgi:asparagine synthase (glutamine-hydrolysing)
MCAIVGYIDYKKTVEERYLLSMMDTMVLRGPDDKGTYVNGNVGLGHRRLSIIDVKSGHQPMSIDNGNIVIVFNGEIYNFQEIRDDLSKTGGIEFNTTSDTEVILYAYKCWGIEGCLEHLEGMFAFAIYDKNQAKVYVARDRYGEKPLYYSNTEGSFIFASELKAFHPSSAKYVIDKIALNLYLTLNYIPAPYTIYEGISKMLPGHYYEITMDGDVIDHLYYDVRNEHHGYINDEEKAIENVRGLLKDSVRKRMISDVPMGAFLSGGIDSSIVCCLMSQLSNEPINTFSIGFKEKDYDESERAEIIAKHIKSNHTKFVLDYSDVIDILDDIILYYDEPYGDSSSIPSYYVAKLASEKVKVVLTGDCADELFGGYDKYLAQYYANKYKKCPLVIRKMFESLVNICPITPMTNEILRKIKKVIRNSEHTGFDLYYDMLGLGFVDENRKNVLNKEYFKDIRSLYEKKWNSISSDEFTYLLHEQLMDAKGVLEGQMFVKVDRACMHVSLENRAPFIDRRIVNLALNLDDHLKIKGNNKKYILKEAFKDILPSETLKFKKSGFGVPVDYWFRNELKNELMNFINKEFLERQGIFDYQAIKEMADAHLSGKENNKGALWNFYVFQKWYTKIYKRAS